MTISYFFREVKELLDMAFNVPPFQECKSPIIEKSHHGFFLESRHGPTQNFSWCNPFKPTDI